MARQQHLGMIAPKQPASLGMRLVKWFVIFFFVALLLVGAALFGLFWYYSKDLPDVAALKVYDPVQVTRIYAANGELIGELLFPGPNGEKERRTPIALKDIPKRLIDAFLCAEDADFYQHGGVDYPGIARAAIKAVLQGEFTQGASTITQQVVKTFLLSPERTLKRKVQEMMLARSLEEALSKEQILHLYLNQIYFGHQRYGVFEAARYYFSKDLEKLTLSEMAVLAGIPKAPSELNPEDAQKGDAPRTRLEGRRRFVLQQMLQKGKISQKEFDAASKEPIPFKKIEEPYLGIAPGFVDMVRDDLRARFDESALSHLGARIETTLDVAQQVAAQKALRAALEKLDTEQGYRNPDLRPPKNVQKFLEDASVEIADGFQYGKTYSGVIIASSDALGGYLVNVGGKLGWVTLKNSSRYNPKEVAPSAFAEVGDVVPVTVRSSLASGFPETFSALQDKDPQLSVLKDAAPKAQRAIERELALDLGPEGAFVAVDPTNFALRAMVGAYQEQPGGLNRARLSKRQPGSTFKPVVYSAALHLKCQDVADTVSGTSQRRCYNPATILRDSVIVSEDGKWIPKNADSKELGEIPMRKAIALSQNLATINLAREVTMPVVVAYAKQLGYESKIEPVLASAIGASEVTPMEQALVYSVFASGGKRRPIWYVKKIVLASGKVMEEKAIQEEQVVPKDVAYLTTSLLQSVIQEGTGSKARDLGRPSAGKTGTTNDTIDTWFVGYTPELTAALWLGFDDRRPLKSKKGKSVSGGNNAAPFWTQFMREALAGKPVSRFAEPAGIVRASIDPRTGLLAYDGQKDAKEEVFSIDAVPTERALSPDEATEENYLLQGGSDDE